jgi:hypothetical protein
MKRPILYALLFAAANAGAQPGPGGQRPPEGGGERRGPPQEFFDACKGKAEGTSVSARGPRGEEVKGTCRMVMVPAGPMQAPPPKKK